MRERGKRIRAAMTAAALSTLVTAAAAVEAGAAELRFVHAAPGAGEAVLYIDGRRTGSPVGFGEIGEYGTAPERRVQLSVRPASGGEALGGGTGVLGPGRHTAVAWLRNGRFELSVLDDAAGSEGRARLRAVNAAGELGRVSIRLDGRALGAPVSPGESTRYAAQEPGTYSLQVRRAGGSGTPLATERNLRLTAGTSSTAFVFGSGGEPVRVVTASDSSAAPERAPATGLGGLDSDRPWLALALAALAAGVLGGGGFMLVRRRGAL